MERTVKRLESLTQGYEFAADTAMETWQGDSSCSSDEEFRFIPPVLSVHASERARDVGEGVRAHLLAARLVKPDAGRRVSRAQAPAHQCAYIIDHMLRSYYDDCTRLLTGTLDR